MKEELQLLTDMNDYQQKLVDNMRKNDWDIQPVEGHKGFFNYIDNDGNVSKNLILGEAIYLGHNIMMSYLIHELRF